MPNTESSADNTEADQNGPTKLRNYNQDRMSADQLVSFNS